MITARTVHDPEDSRIEVFAFDRERGQLSRTTRLTRNAVGSTSDSCASRSMVYNSSHDFTCSVGVADGIERACVDRRGLATVIDFGDDQIVAP